MRLRGFEVIEKYSKSGIILPGRKTGGSAGYDLASAEDMDIQPGKTILVPTGLKAYMQSDEVLLIYIRSGLSCRHGLILMNQVGVIDSDYYNSPENEGHIQIALLNMGDNIFHIEKGMRIAQGVFSKYLPADGDVPGMGADRRGGFGSTGS